MPKEINTITTILVGLLFLVAALPLKNYLEIKRCRSIQKIWDKWLSKKPSLLEYCKAHDQDISNPSCDYCSSMRHTPTIEFSMLDIQKFGLVNNSHNGYIYYKTYICSGCSSQLYREKTKSY